MEEKLSVAPMMDWTNPHFRHLLRLVSTKTVLYTEMAVDNTVIYNTDGFLEERIGLVDPDGPAVIQLGGSDPDSLARASEILNDYGILSNHYQELNLNCGCPSNKVTQRGCFGAKLMLQPGLVRQIVHSMKRKVSCPVTVKCRLGVTNHRDTYAELVEFISEAHLGGANKFIIHCRDCVLEGLSTKQNREIPPLRYEELGRLRQDFPDLTFVLNGGVQSLDAALQHINPDSSLENDNGNSECLNTPHGVMMGRAVMHDPLLLATADTRVFGCRRDQGLSRRELLVRYGEYCDRMEGQMADIIEKKERVFHRSTTAIWNAYRRNLLGGVANIFTGIRGNKEYVKHVHPTDSDIARYFTDDYKLGEHIGGSKQMLSQYLDECTRFFSDESLDKPTAIHSDETLPSDRG
jgi:tRNA-dihydrouridine synthase A